VLAAHDLAETRLVRRCFARQSIASRIELVLVLPAEAASEPPDDLFAGLGGGRIVEVERIGSRGRANAAGVRAATAAVVALAEDHSLPDPGWAEALVADHEGPWAVVAPRVANANPDTSISWADFVIGYGPWSPASTPGERRFLPGHNSSYKTAVLLELGDGLEAALDAETLLHWNLAQRGLGLLLSERALIRHVNFSRAEVFRRAQVLNGRAFAGLRCASWGPARRLLYTAASPLIPLVRAWRLRSGFGGSGAPFGAVPAFALGLALDALGQGLGYARGPGAHDDELAHYEFGRLRFVTEGDRRSIEALAAGAP
jgi:hypothetical protein